MLNNNHSFYNDDIAYIHATGFCALAQNAAAMILRSLQKQNITKGHIVDLGSGNGVIAQILTQHGYTVTGIEYSDAFISLAQTQSPQATFIKGSFFDIDIPSCDAIISTNESLNYIKNQSTRMTKEENEEELKKLINKISNALSPSGIFIFDILEPNKENPRSRCYLTEHKEWTLLSKVEENFKNAQLLRSIVAFRKIDDLYRKTNESHMVQLYSKAFITNCLTNASFSIETFNSYESFGLSSHHLGFLCTKK